ncbi:MAG: pyruvate kinase [Desulfitobacterium hafniense]|nr:pyruvate kinase [Desulfitobacterium hafniense]
MNGGEISSRKGVNIPGAEISLPPITEQDTEDIRFGIKHGLYFIAASFVRKASDVLEIRKILEEAGADIHIYAKIENQEGLQNIEEILQVSDGIMVARGDLGVEIPAEEVPLAQKMIISLCNKAGKPVITATQMLDSMMRNPRPTRAEASDVANAIFDGSDAIMLSGETAAGKWPVEAVATMAQIALRIEEALDYAEVFDKKRISAQRTITDAISHATVNTANDLGATAIISATKSGQTARMVSKYRPKAPIIAATPREDVLRKLLIAWGITPILVADTLGTDEMIAEAVNGALCSGVITAGSLVVITAGVPVGIPGTTNLLKVHVVGDVVAAGAGIGDRVVNGKVKICLTAEDALDRVKEGDILVAPATDRDYVPAMERAAAVITEEGGLTSHAAIVGLNLDTVVVVGVEKAIEILREDQIITVDGNHGHIYEGITHVL